MMAAMAAIGARWKSREEECLRCREGATGREQQGWMQEACRRCMEEAMGREHQELTAPEEQQQKKLHIPLRSLRCKELRSSPSMVAVAQR